MKKVLLLAIGSLGLLACNRDSDTVDNALVGTWKPSKEVVYNGKDNTVVLSQTAFTGCEVMGYFTFRNGGVLDIVAYEEGNTGNCEGKEERATYQYNEVNNVITVSLPGEKTPTTTRVFKLTATELHLVTEEADKNNDGTPDVVVDVFVRK